MMINDTNASSEAAGSTANASACVGEACEMLAASALDAAAGLETSWLLLCSFLVISMQLGFAMLEVGSVREAHRMTVLAKNIMDSAVSCLVFSIATSAWQSSLILSPNGNVMFDRQLFHWAFCGTCVTICSGSMAERTHIVAYLVHAALIAGIIFPPIAEAVWGNGSGFMRHLFYGQVHKDYAYHDCAGSGVVHLIGGVSALVGNALLGRRIMRPDDPEIASWLDPETAVETVPKHADSSQPSEQVPAVMFQRRFDDVIRDQTEFIACNYLQVMGMFILWVGWYGFNAGGSLTASSNSAYAAGLVSWNTTMAAAAGGLGSYLYLYGFRLNLDTCFLCNGLLSGLVSVTAGCDVATPLATMLIGLMAGLVVYPATSQTLQWLRIDDPVDAVPVHAGAGLFGVLATGLCRPDCKALGEVGAMTAAQAHFCREDHSIGLQFLAQLWGCLVMVGWTLIFSASFWTFLVVSERVRALELEHVSRAETLLKELMKVFSDKANTEIDEGLKTAANFSRTLRRLLKEHGWTGSSFIGGLPDDPESLLTKLQNVQTVEFQTALEANPCWGVRKLVVWFSSCWICRDLACLRMRIHPFAELSGLGAADARGGKLYTAIHRAATQVAEMRQNESDSAPLKKQLQELGLMVRNQDALLRKLMRRKGAGPVTQSNRRLGSLLEEKRPRVRTGQPMQGSLMEEPAPAPPEIPGLAAHHDNPTCGDANSLPSTARSSRSAWTENSSHFVPDMSQNPMLPALRLELPSETASTVSDASMGCLSPTSVQGSTPPPTVHGRMQQPASMQSSGSNVAEQLVSMLQAQQQLISMMMQGQGTWPLQTPQGQTQMPQMSVQMQQQPGLQTQPMQRQMLFSALQQVADSQLLGTPQQTPSGASTPPGLM
eukprot:TRINITY_DN60815_c0_g1_i1.p1 TRINITY_DN60815_c0_g1~~TRINITY_DN60815_c0_g1_i1.p1  ORF type:complete len:886 (+),score=149.39 TRINITY_DN60815_c0_g1_i1:73-2730(+)